MKKALVLVLVAAAGLAAYMIVNEGALPFGSGSMDEDERDVARLEYAFDEANEQYQRAARAAAISGMDTTTEAEAARLEVKRLRDELERLRGELVSNGAKERARRLDTAMRTFLGT